MEKVLARTQENELFALIQRVGLDPADFAWSLEHHPPARTLHEKAVHRPTGSRFELWLDRDGDFWFDFWPNHVGGPHHSYVKGWASAKEKFSGWLQCVRRDHEAPDLW